MPISFLTGSTCMPIYTTYVKSVILLYLRFVLFEGFIMACTLTSLQYFSVYVSLVSLVEGTSSIIIRSLSSTTGLVIMLMEDELCSDKSYIQREYTSMLSCSIQTYSRTFSLLKSL